VAAVNAALVWLFDTAAASAMRVAPLATLVALSVLTGLAMLWVAGRVTNQHAVAAAKRGIHAALFEVRLFNDDLRAMLRAVGRVLWQNLLYLRHSFVVLLWVAVPLFFVVGQLQAFYGYQGLTVGQSTLLTVQLRETQARAVIAAGGFSLEAPDGIRVDTPAIVLPGAGEVSWRIVPTAPGDYTLTTHVEQTSLAKQVHVSNGIARRSPARVAAEIVDQFSYPSEPPLPEGSAVAAITLAYPERGLDVLGWRIHWVALYVIVSMLTALVFAKRLGVTL
jgi:hypothetical protein